MAAKSQQWSRTVCLALCTISIVCALNESPGLDIFPKQDKQTAPQGQTYALTCRGSLENPSLFSNLRWIDPRGDEVKHGERMKMSSDEGKITLQFMKPTADDSGIYKCIANFQNSEEKTAEVQITFFKTLTWEDCSTAQALVLGRSGEKVKCRVTASPSPSVSWRKNGKRVDERRYVLENHAIAVKGEVKEEDAGMYEVEALVESTGALDFRAIEVSVHIEPKIEAFPDEGEFAVETEEKVLHCKASGKPDPLYTWFDPAKRNLSSVAGFIVNRITGQLTIIKVAKPETEGEFTCVAENAAGRDEKKIQLHVLEKPKLVSFANISIVEGDEATLECRFSGNPLPVLTMKKEMQTEPIFTDGKHLVTQLNETNEAVLKVSIKNLRREDGGLYYCAAENRVAQVNQAGHLQVEFKPDVSKTNLIEMTWEKRPVNLTCVVSAVPNASVTWYKNGNPIDENDLFKFYSDPIGGHYKLRVIPSSRIVFGDYDCKAQNSRGEMSARINLMEAFVPNAPGRIEIRNSTPTALKFVISDVTLRDRLPIKGFILEYREKHSTLSLPLKHEYATNYADENVLLNLIPSTEYILRAALKNEVGQGDFSVEFPATTAAKTVPTIPRIISDDHFGTLTGGDIISEHATQFVIKWLPSEDNGAAIKGYEIKYIKVVMQDGWRIVSGEDWVKVSAEPTVSSVSLNNLDPGTIYKAEITAVNEMGSSVADVIVFKTKGSEFVTETNPSVQQSHSPSSVTLVIVITLLIVIFVLIVMDIIFYVRCQVGLSYFIRTQLCGTQSSVSSKGKGDEAETGGVKSLMEVEVGAFASIRKASRNCDLDNPAFDRGGTEMPNEELTPMMINGSHGRVDEAQKKPVMPKDSQV